LIRKYLQKIYLALIFILLYAPIVTLIVLSFNQSKTRAKWGGFTLKWYKELLKNEQIMSAFYTTLIIAFVSAAIATVIGTAAAIAIQGMKQKWKTMYMGLTNIPMMNAEIVMGVSLMLLFIAFHMTLGFGTILIAHITFNIPYVILSVLPKLKQTNRYTYEAALDLGASPVKAFFKVVFPDIVPGVFSGFMLAFTMSLDDFIITHFTRGAGINTLSTLIYSEVRRGIKPSMYALSTIIFVTVLALLLITNFAPRDDAAKAGSKRAGRPETGGKQNDNEMAGKKRIGLILRGPGFKKGLLAAASFAIVCTVCAATYIRYASQSSNELYVYNWGEYIDESVIEEFEEETGIDVIYDLFETNEEMYPVVEAGGVAYDVVCPSDYMIQKMACWPKLTTITYRILKILIRNIWKKPRALILATGTRFPTPGAQ